MLTEFENNSCVCPVPVARENREERLAAKHAREKHILEHLEQLADFIAEVAMQFLPQTSGKPIVDVTLSSTEVPSKIVLRIDESGKVIDVTDVLSF